MRALVATGPTEFSFTSSYPTPQVPSGWVLLEPLYVGLCGSDLVRFAGQGSYYHWPAIYGHEFSARIKQLPSKSSLFEVGDIVAVLPVIPGKKFNPSCHSSYFASGDYDFIGSRRDGALSDLVAAPLSNLIRLQPGVDPQVAALFEPFAVALRAIQKVSFAPDSSVVIFGAGVIGLSLALLLRYHFGLNQITLVTKEDSPSINLVNQLGFSRLGFSQIQSQLQMGQHFDFQLAFQACGSATALPVALTTLCPAGTLVNLGTYTSDIVIPSSLFNQALKSEKVIITSQGFHLTLADTQLLADFLDQQTTIIRQMIYRVVPLSQAETHIRRLLAHQDTTIKTLVQVH
jgi:threonine dehydrogenase-like Zn-dependent dehydrogenase